MSSSNKQFLALRVDPDLLAAIDAVAPARGRTKWIEDACRCKLEGAPADATAAAEAKISIQVSESFTVTDAAAIGETIGAMVGSVAGESDGAAGHTLNPASCAHIVLGIPRQNPITGVTVRDCRACGQPQVVA